MLKMTIVKLDLITDIDMENMIQLGMRGGISSITHRNGKQKYTLHYKNLNLYLNLGLKLKTIHRVLEFKQTNWLKKYIDFNTEKRTNATNDFEKDFF